MSPPFALRIVTSSDSDTGISCNTKSNATFSDAPVALSGSGLTGSAPRRRTACGGGQAARFSLAIAALTRGMTCSAMSCIERLASFGSTQSMPA